MKALFYASLGVAILLFAGTLVFAGEEWLGRQILIAMGSIAVATIIICASDSHKDREKQGAHAASEQKRRK